MQAIYQQCPCGSGTKFKFCCFRKNMDEFVQQSEKFPLYRCCATDNYLENHGGRVVLVSRRILDDRYIYAAYMLDMYCLGLKDTVIKANIGKEEVDEWLGKFDEELGLVEIKYSDARSLILGAVDYALRLGFKPHEDWRQSKFVIEADKPYESKFEYGYEGKPLYIQGPYDDAEMIMKKLSKVEHHYIVGEPAMSR